MLTDLAQNAADRRRFGSLPDFTNCEPRYK